ncbi:T6SS effector BTH_I2691 family protein, partial [Acinetobacter sp. Res13-Abat-PEC12-P5-02]
KDEKLVKYLYAKDKIPKYATNIDQREYQKRMDELWEKASNAEKQKVLDDYNKKFEPQKLKDKIQVASKAKAELVWNEKYKPKIDWNSKKSFDLKVKQLTESGKANAMKYANDHINWLKSNALLQALHAYDQNEVKEYGFLFHTHVMAMLHGMSGFDVGQALLEEWLSAAKVDYKNLYYRAVCYNQKSLIEKFNNCAPSLMTLTWDQSQGTLKNTIATFVAFDQLWDEWLTTGKYKVDELKWYNPAKSVYWISEITRTVTKWSLQYNLNSKMAAGLAKISFIAYAHGSLLTNKVPKWSLLYNVDLRNANAANRLNATEIQKTWKKVEENTAAKKIKEILNQSPESGKIRISSIVALFELINLATQSNKFMAEKNWENGFQITAGLFASTAVVLDIAGGGMEALSFADKANKIRLCGGIFAVTGAAFSFFADSTALGKEMTGDKNPWLSALLISKLLVSLGMFLVGFGMLIRIPILHSKLLSEGANKALIARFLTNNVIKYAARLNFIGLGIAIIEIVLKTWFIPNDVQKWCTKTVFGVGEKKYKTVKEEDDEFVKALESI